MNVYRQLLEGVTTERDELKQNLERVNARWDGKVKRLEAQLARKSDTTAAGVCVMFLSVVPSPLLSLVVAHSYDRSTSHTLYRGLKMLYRASTCTCRLLCV